MSLSLYLHVYLSSYTYIHIYIHIYIYIYIYTYMYLHTNTHVYIYIYIYRHIYMYMCIYIRMSTYAYMSNFICIYLPARKWGPWFQKIGSLNSENWSLILANHQWKWAGVSFRTRHLLVNESFSGTKNGEGRYSKLTIIISLIKGLHAFTCKLL